MVALSTLFLAFVIVFDLVLSLWNAYAAGFSWTLLRGRPGQRFAKASAIAGLGLAFAGMCYAVLIVLSYAALLLGFLGLGDFLFLVSFDFLVFGAMIIGFGLVVTAQSVAVAIHDRNPRAVLVAIYNVVVEIWDVSIYAEGFKDAAGVVSSDRNRVNLYAVIAAAVGISFIVTYVAYRHGARKAEDQLGSNPEYSAVPTETQGGRAVPRSHELRTILLAALVTVLVVLALIWVAPYVLPKTAVVVTEIDVFAPTDVCGLNDTLISYVGFNSTVGSSIRFGFEILNFNASACNLTGVSTNTSGFGVTDFLLPLTVGPSQNGTLNATVTMPSSPYHGILNLIYT